MQIGMVGKGLVALGIIVLLYALNMSVALPGSDTINLHMISERQNMLMIGGLFFIGGIILFAVAKLKQSGEEDAREIAHQLETTQKAKELVGAVSVRSAEIAQTTVPRLWQKYCVRLSQGWHSLFIRLFFGYFCGAEAYLAVYLLAYQCGASPDFGEAVGNWTSLMVLVYAFRNAQLPKVLKHIFVFTLALVCIFTASMVPEMEGLPTKMLIKISVLLVGIIVVMFIERHFNRATVNSNGE